jgi:hypothetical protein
MLNDTAIRPAVYPDEPAISWLRRWALMTGYTSVTSFADRLGLSAYAVANGKANAELARHAGLPDDAFEPGTVRFERYLMTWRGTAFRLRTEKIPRGRFCVDCLREDDRTAGDGPEPRGRIRSPWQLPFINACPLHGKLLLDAARDGRALAPFPLHPLLNADPAGPIDASFEATPAASCSAETYIYGRLGLGPAIGTPMLDACSLGTLPRLLWNVGLSSWKNAEYPAGARAGNQIMNAGFAALRDEESLGRVLSELERRYTYAPRINGILPEVRKAVRGLPAVDTRAFREAAARYVADRYPWGGQGRPIFGCEVPQRYYSLEDLYKISGIHHRKMEKLLEHAGVPLADTVLPGVDESGVELLRTHLQSLIGFKELQEVWSVTLQAARDIVRAGIIGRWERDDRANIHQSLFRRDEAQEVVRKAVGACDTRYSSAPKNFLTLRQAAARPGISQPSLVRDLLEGRLACAGLLENRAGLSAILVRLEELSDYVPPRFGTIVRTTEACRLIGVSHQIVDSLARGGFLGEELWSRGARLFQREAVLRFASRHISGYRAALLIGTHARLVRPFLAEHGIVPLIHGKQVRANFYSREMVMALAEQPGAPPRKRKR